MREQYHITWELVPGYVCHPKGLNLAAAAAACDIYISPYQDCIQSSSDFAFDNFISCYSSWLFSRPDGLIAFDIQMNLFGRHLGKFSVILLKHWRDQCLERCETILTSFFYISKFGTPAIEIINLFKTRTASLLHFKV